MINNFQISGEDTEIATVLIKILRNQVLDFLKNTIEVSDYIKSTEEAIKKYYTPYLVSLLANSFKDNTIDRKSLNHNIQYAVFYFLELQKYSMVITEYSMHQKLKDGESVEIEKRLDTPMVTNKNSITVQEFAEKLYETLLFNKRINPGLLEKIVVTKINKKVFKLIIKHSYQVPITLIVPVATIDV